MTRVLPAWQAFDPDRPDTGAPDFAAPEGPLLALLVSPALHRTGWAPRAAAGLAGRGTLADGRILLADLGLQEPRLHEVLGTPAGEGMSDAFVFGASIQRIARPTEGGFLFAPAGTPVAEPGSVLASPRWSPVLDAFRQAGAHMLLYLPWDLPGREALLARAAGVVILADEDEVRELDPAEFGEHPVHAVLGPVNGREEAGLASDGIGRETAGSSDAASPAPSEGGIGGGSGVEEGADDEGIPVRPTATDAELPRREPARPGKRRRLGVVLLLVVLAVLATLTAAFLGLIHIPGVPELNALSSGRGTAGSTSLQGGVQEPVPAQTGEDVRPTGSGGTQDPGSGMATPSAGSSSSPDLRGSDGKAGVTTPHPSWSLSIASYQDPRVGREHAEALQRNQPERTFVLAPVRVGDQTWYRLLVGPAEDSAAAERLRDGLGAGGSGWSVRPTPLAFQLAELPTAAEARERVAALPPEIPAYVLAAPPGSPGLRFRVYAGAYANAAEASRMEEILRNHGRIDIPLVPRLGTLLPPPSVQE